MVVIKKIPLRQNRHCFNAKVSEVIVASAPAGDLPVCGVRFQHGKRQVNGRADAVRHNAATLGHRHEFFYLFAVAIARANLHFNSGKAGRRAFQRTHHVNTIGSCMFC